MKKYCISLRFAFTHQTVTFLIEATNPAEALIKLQNSDEPEAKNLDRVQMTEIVQIDREVK